MIMTTSVELREKRATAINEAQTKWNEAEAREGGPTAEDKQAFDAAMDGADALLERIKRMERLEVATSDLDSPTPRTSEPLHTETRDRQTGELATKETTHKKLLAFRHWLRTGEVRSELRGEQSRAMSPEYRDTVITTDSKGGFLITPVQISADIVRLIQDQVYIRQLCAEAGAITTVTDAKKLGIRKRITDMSDANWTTEVAAVTEDTSMAFDRRDLEPQLCSKLALISIRTLLLSTDAENEVNQELAYKFGVTEEKAFISGNGTGQPLGIYTASANGISVARDIPAASATAVTGDDLINLKFSLKQGYQQDKATAWVVSREFVKRTRKLKVATTTGGNDLEYIWQPGLTEGAPDRILDIPYYMSEYAPGTFTTGLYVAVLGCFRFYRIAQVAEMMMQRLVELYAATNQVGIIGRRWVDGSPVLEEAFARLKLA
jgi:HK97 family phage major capsid protein